MAQKDILSRLSDLAAQAETPEQPEPAVTSEPEVPQAADAPAPEPVDLESIDPSSLSASERAIYDAWANQRAEFDDEKRALRRSHHGAGRIDNDIMQKAQLYDAMMQDPQQRAAAKSKDPLADLPEATRKAIEEAGPEYIQAIEAISKRAVYNDDHINSVLKEAQTIIDSQKQNRMRTLQKQAADLQKSVGSIPADVQEDMMAILGNPHFEDRTVAQVYRMVTGREPEPKKQKATPPPPSPKQPVAERTTEEPPRPRTKDFHEAAKRAFERVAEQSAG